MFDKKRGKNELKASKNIEKSAYSDSLGGGVLYNLLNKDVKEINKVFISLFGVGIILIAGFTSYKLTNTSYALFNDTITGEKTIEVEVTNHLDRSGANLPELDSSMIPVYYDEEEEVWKKADEENKIKEYRWYDYNNKIWANSVTYDHERAYNEGNTYEGRTFSGSQYINTGNASYNFGKTITIAARFKVSKTGVAQNIISNAEAAGFYLTVSSTNKLQFYIYGTKAAAYKSVISTTTVTSGKWYTAVATYNGSQMRLYVNGVLEATLSITDTIKTSTQPIFIGANPNADGVHQTYFYGTVEEALVLKETLSASEVEKHYVDNINYTPSSNLVFHKKYGNQKTYLENVTYTEEGAVFNGSSSYINAGYTDYSLGSKVTYIVRFKVSQNLSTDQSIINNYQTGGAGIYISNSTNNNKIGFQIYGTKAGAYKYIDSGITPEVGKWYTVVGTYNGSQLKLYVNGILENSMSLSDTIKSSTVPLFLGANPNAIDNMEYFKGVISDAIVINDTLTETEIKQNYSNQVNYQTNSKTLFYYDLRSYEGRENGSAVPMEIISTMQVWIPRYKYKIWNYNSDGTKTSNPQEIEIAFEEGIETTGEITCTDTISGTDGAKSESCKINNVECTDSTCNNKWYTHPAFTFGEEQIKGFWIGKFELTGTITNITTKPNLTSIRNQTVSSFETNIMKMNDAGNIYGFSTNTDTHMIKNMEWGSVAYLSHSKYGTCTDGSCSDIGLNNNSDNFTGCGSEAGSISNTACNSYETSLGIEASTTHNIYGVYDMSGGSYESVMGGIVFKNGTTMMSGFSTSVNSGYTGIVYDSENYTSYTGTYDFPASKYYDKYSFGESADQRIRSKLGDGIKEVFSGTYGWYNDASHLGNKEYPWFGRGGFYVDAYSAGLFYSGLRYSGSTGSNATSRLIITP